MATRLVVREGPQPGAPVILVREYPGDLTEKQVKGRIYRDKLKLRARYPFAHFTREQTG